MSICPLATREAVKAALDIAKTSRANWQIDAALQAATETVEGDLNRTFRPYLATRTFDWPKPYTPTRTWRLWLNDLELLEATTVVVAGVTLTTAQYYLSPQQGPPYTHVEANVNTLGAFPVDTSWQRAISITGRFGYRDDETNTGTLTAAVASTSATTVAVSNGATVGVGDLLRVDDEYLTVTDRAWAAVDTLGSSLTESQAGRAVTVTDGSLFHPGELIAVDSETLWVTDITGNVLTCRRAWDGSTLAAHSNGATVYASRTLTVTRAAQGSTAATHLSAATVWRHDPPPLIQKATIGHALLIMGAESSGYQQTTGAGETGQQWTATGIGAICEAARSAHGRVARFR